VVNAALARIGAPEAMDLILANLILLPEGVAARGAAGLIADELQPRTWLLARYDRPDDPRRGDQAMALGTDLELGLDAKDGILLGLPLLVSLITFGTGRTNILHGFVHLVIFATFVFLVLVP